MIQNWRSSSHLSAHRSPLHDHRHGGHSALWRVACDHLPVLRSRYNQQRSRAPQAVFAAHLHIRSEPHLSSWFRRQWRRALLCHRVIRLIIVQYEYTRQYFTVLPSITPAFNIGCTYNIICIHYIRTEQGCKYMGCKNTTKNVVFCVSSIHDTYTIVLLLKLEFYLAHSCGITLKY